jgi:ABC-type multidrug transport system fused ATPase/permease subunit
MEAARMSKWQLILAPARRRIRVMWWALPLALFSVGLTVLQPWPMKILVDCVLSSAPPPPILKEAIGMIGLNATPHFLLVMVAIMSLCQFCASRLIAGWLSWISVKGSWETVHSLAETVFDRLQRRSLAFHKSSAVGDLMNRVLADTRCAQEFLEKLMFELVVSVVTIASMLVLMIRINVPLTFLAFAALPFSWTISTYAARRLRSAARASRDIEGRIQSQIRQALIGIGVVQAFAQEAQEDQRFRNLAERHVQSQRKRLLLGMLTELATGLVSTLTSGLVLWLIAREVLAGTATLGSGLVFLAYFGTLQGQLGVLRGVSSTVHVVAESANRVAQIVETPVEIVDKADARDVPRIRGAVEFRNVTAGYDGKPVLHNVSFQVEPGQMVALIGPTGSGKTTVVNLIPRFEDPLVGCVLIDGYDVRDLELKCLRRQVAITFQEPFLSSESVAECIAYGRMDATAAEIEVAARAAQAHDFIKALPHGYDTRIGERGLSLSGGMRQRISMARALLKNAPVLILDEPSSALDAETEALMFESLLDLTRGRTVFIVAHRYSTLRQADLIVALKNGVVIEKGDPSDLLERGGYFARLQAAINHRNVSSIIC